MALGHEKKDYVCDIIPSCTFAGKEFVRKKIVSLKREERLVMCRNKNLNRKDLLSMLIEILESGCLNIR